MTDADTIRALRQVMAPFLSIRDALPVHDAVKLIAMRFDGLTPVAVTVTKTQYLAAFEAFQAAEAPLTAPANDSGDRLEAARQSGLDQGADFVLDRLAKALGLASWVPADGTETWDGDVTNSMYGILHAARVVDPETDRLATARADDAVAETARLRQALEEAKHWHEANDKALSESGPTVHSYYWRRNQHREQIEALTAALAEPRQ